MAAAAKTVGADATGGEAAPAPNRKKKLIIAGALGLLLVGGGASFLLRKSGSAAVPGKPAVAFVDMTDMFVNLASEPGQDRPKFLKVKVALEMKDSGAATAVQPLMPRVQDTFQVFLREMRQSDLEGSGGIHRLREELLRRVNMAVAPARVEAVLFREVVVQ